MRPEAHPDAATSMTTTDVIAVRCFMDTSSDVIATCTIRIFLLADGRETTRVGNRAVEELCPFVAQKGALVSVNAGLDAPLRYVDSAPYR